MKKLLRSISFICVLSILLATTGDIDIIALESNKLKVPEYRFSKAAYDELLNNLENESIFYREDVEYYEKKENGSIWNINLVEFLLDRNRIQEYMNTKERGIEIQEYRVLEFIPDICNIGFYIPATIWIKTNQGVRLIAFDDKYYMRDEYMQGLNYDLLIDNRYFFIYYLETDDYVEEFKERYPSVYVNGTKQDIDDFIVRRNEYVTPMRPIMEALGIEVKWNDIYSTFTLSKDGKAFHCVIHHANTDEDGNYSAYYREGQWDYIIFDDKDYQTYCRFLLAGNIIPNKLSEDKREEYFEDINQKAIYIMEWIAMKENMIIMSRADIERILKKMFGMELQTEFDTEQNAVYLTYMK